MGVTKGVAGGSAARRSAQAAAPTAVFQSPPRCAHRPPTPAPPVKAECRRAAQSAAVPKCRRPHSAKQRGGPAPLSPPQPAMALSALLPPPGAAFLPLHQPIMQLPMPRPRAYRGFSADSLVTPRRPLPVSATLADHRLQDLLARRDPPVLPAATTSTTTTPASTTPTSTTTVTTAAPTTFVRATSRWSAAPREAPRFVSQFHSGPLQSRKGGDHGDDDGVVLLVGLFNLLAVVVYAAHRHLRAEPHALSERVIQWQVQKVLDELVIKVHSSSYAANLLSRAMPHDAPLQHARAAPAATPWHLLLLRQARALLLHQDPEAARWLQDARRRLLQDVAASPAALHATTLRPEMYAPVHALYTALATGRAAAALEGVLAAAEGEQGRALEGRTPHLAALLDSLAHLDTPQLRSLLAALTALGRAQQRVNVLPRLSSLLGAAAPPVPTKVRARRATGQRQARAASARRPRRIMRRQGKVVEEGSGHWTDRWFSLVTKAAPVGLDLTTLYARARARPTCLRALLCRANNAWRQVGPLQAALTPFTSVVLSWVLEDTAPHSLGDSLIAIRAGWMGKPCAVLYPECRLTPDPHPAAKEAITFFSRLQFAATQPKEEVPPPTLPHAQQQQQQKQQQQQQQPSSSTTTTTHNNNNNNKKNDKQENKTDYQNTHTSSSSSSSSSSSYIPSAYSPPASSLNPSYTQISYQGTEDTYTAPQQPGHSYTHYTDTYTAPGQETGGGEGGGEGLNTGFLGGEEEGGGDLNAGILQGGGGETGGANTDKDLINLYYNRYGGKGPMALPGTQYTTKYAHRNPEDTHTQETEQTQTLQEKIDRRDDTHNHHLLLPDLSTPHHHHHHHQTLHSLPNELYEKYESPDSSVGEEGDVLSSGSVSGMALQDPPAANTAVTWQQFFNAGLYGSSGQQKVPEGGAVGGTAGTGVIAGRPREHPQHPQHTANHKIGVAGAGRQPLKTYHHHHNHHQHSKTSQPVSQPARPSRPTFLLRPHLQQYSHNQQPVKKYKYGLRRGLPAGNVNNNKYDDNFSINYKYDESSMSNDIHQPHKAWYSYTARPDTYHYHTTTPITTTTTTTTTKRPTRDIDPFGPEDAVTSVLRNELLYEFVRDRQGFVKDEEEEEEEEDKEEGRSVR
ncbi:uncharacterized protein LOC135113042 isoform X1 [Scylla paramamosain]|uniref:uncharacterized protein LOC135113042 isoform X1 n=2 Tax=Scylla paramamosain TaxID=85552 RepID=UPI003083570F